MRAEYIATEGGRWLAFPLSVRYRWLLQMELTQVVPKMAKNDEGKNYQIYQCTDLNCMANSKVRHKSKPGGPGPRCSTKCVDSIERRYTRAHLLIGVNNIAHKQRQSRTHKGRRHNKYQESSADVKQEAFETPLSWKGISHPEDRNMKTLKAIKYKRHAKSEDRYKYFQ